MAKQSEMQGNEKGSRFFNPDPYDQLQKAMLQENGMVEQTEIQGNELDKNSKFFSLDPYDQLQKALTEDDLEIFEELLKSHTSNDKFNINHACGGPDCETLLHKACQTKNLGLFVRILIKYGANVNLVYKTCQKAPLHFAVESADIAPFQYLLDSPNIDVNILDDTGSTALHLACNAGKLEQVKALLKHPNVMVNAENRQGETPISLAMEKRNEDIILELLGHKDTDIDGVQTKSGKMIRECIEENFPTLVYHLPEPRRNTNHVDEKDVVSKLFTYLRLNDLESFKRLIKADPRWVNSDDGHQTLFQYACERGLIDFVSLLVHYGADINQTCINDSKTGLMTACTKGYYKIVQFLIAMNSVSLAATNDETILHTVVKNGASSFGVTDEGQDHLKCLKVILSAALSKLNINQGDVKGNTVLHYAAKTGNRDIIFLLIDHGAYIGARNVFGEPPLGVIAPKILEAYLDRCISANKKLPSECDYEIIFKYNFLVPPNLSKPETGNGKDMIDIERNAKLGVPISETYPLLYMSQSAELRPLLTHPILTSFICLKWYSVRRLFYLNLAFFSVFCLFLTMYILFCYGDDSEFITGKENQTSSSHFSALPKSKFIAGGLLWCVIRHALIALLGVLIFREFLQIYTSPMQYTRSLENWLETPLIIVTLMILFFRLSKNLRNQLSAVGILLSWGELFLLMGKQPSLSTKAEMFKTVSLNFFKFLSFYSILIFAFALSFYSLFKDTASVKNPGFKELLAREDIQLNNSTAEKNTFSKPVWSIFKTVVMLTGEFDSASIPFDSSPIISHLMFILFVFLIAIVLFNLLNGLAVSDTQDIRTKAKLVGYVSRVKFISFTETMMSVIPFPLRGFAEYIRSVYCCVPDRFLASNFPESIRVLPNQENRVDLVPTGHRRKREYLEASKKSISCFGKCNTSMLKRSIVRAARDVLHRQIEETGQNDTVEMKRKLDEYGQRLLQLEVRTQQSQETLNKMFTMIEDIHKGCSFC